MRRSKILKFAVVWMVVVGGVWTLFPPGHKSAAPREKPGARTAAPTPQAQPQSHTNGAQTVVGPPVSAPGSVGSQPSGSRAAGGAASGEQASAGTAAGQDPQDYNPVLKAGVQQAAARMRAFQHIPGAQGPITINWTTVKPDGRIVLKIGCGGLKRSQAEALYQQFLRRYQDSGQGYIPTFAC